MCPVRFVTYVSGRSENPRVVRGYWHSYPYISPRSGLLTSATASEAAAASAENSVLQFSPSRRARRLPWSLPLVLSFECFRPALWKATGWRRSKGGWQAAQSWVRLRVSFAGASLATPIERSCSIVSPPPRSSWPGARRVPDDIRRAITTTGFTPGMAGSRWV